MLMLFTPENIHIKEMVEKVHTVTGKNQLHHIHVWNLSDNELHFEAHLECSEDLTISQFNTITEAIKKILHHEFHISHCTIQPEFGTKCSKDFIVQD